MYISIGFKWKGLKYKAEEPSGVNLKAHLKAPKGSSKETAVPVLVHHVQHHAEQEQRGS